MMYSDENLLLLSGLQHFAFCRRQWALIHVEQQWQENWRTVEGNLLHQRAHDESIRERRENKLILHNLSVVSRTLGISGQCDVVEFLLDDNGITLQGEDGTWVPYPVEYKHGSPKPHNADRLQLCAQAMCLEEMLCCSVSEGALFYGETRRRERVAFDDALRTSIRVMLQEMHELYQRGFTPSPKPSGSCNACSLKELCLPALSRKKSAARYLAAAVEDL